jgi:hypothetical protein
VEHLPEDQKKTLVAAFDTAANTLREMQGIAAELLLKAQREAAAILLEATMHVLDGRGKR